MNESPSPDWTRLPQDPVRFFELSDDFDRKQLRRSYSRLIRAYKPETHPEEFQRIREAYELLDGQLRYGRPATSRGEVLARDWAEAVASKADAGDGQQPTQGSTGAQPGGPVSPPLWQRVASQSPRELYRELFESTSKSPYDYYALAVLSDLVDRKKPLAFLTWLLKGLSEHREDPGLMRLAAEYFRSDLPEEAIEKTLLATSQVVASDRFYFLTERLWDRFLASQPFALVQATLQKCEDRLRDHRLAGKLAFYIHFLRGALWKADEQWVQERVNWLEAHAGDVGPMLEQDLEFTLLVNEYRQAADAFLDGSPIRRLMDEAIRGYCSSDPVAATHRVIECQDQIARDAQGVMEAFPVVAAPTTNLALMLYRIVSAQVSDEVGADAGGSSPREVERQSLLMLKEMRQEVPKLINRSALQRLMTHIGCGATLAIGPMILLWGLVPAWVFAAWAPIALALYRYALAPLWTEPWLEQRLEKQFRAVYATAWRPRIFRYFQAISAPVGDAIAVTMSAAEQVGDQDWFSWVLELVSGDEGVLLYAEAQRFLR